jgi:hypothetical protein
MYRDAVVATRGDAKHTHQRLEASLPAVHLQLGVMLSSLHKPARRRASLQLGGKCCCGTALSQERNSTLHTTSLTQRTAYPVVSVDALRACLLGLCLGASQRHRCRRATLGRSRSCAQTVGMV